MDTNQNTALNDEDEISLIDLIMVLWKRKVLIIGITLILGILAGLYSKFMITPVYTAKLSIVINMPENYHTKYGDYALPITTNQQYISLIVSNEILLNTINDMEYDRITLEKLRKRISITSDSTNPNTEYNTFEVAVTADNPAEAKKLAQTLYHNYIEFLDIKSVDNAINYYMDYFSVSLRSLEVALESNKTTLRENEALLAATPQTINQKDALGEVQEVAKTTDFIVLENIINPNYTDIEADIINIKQSIIDIENNMSIYTKYLEDLNQDKAKVLDYYETGNFTKLDGNFVSITNSNIYLASEPAAPNQKTSPSNAKNAIIGALLGGVLAILIVIIKEYWLKSNNKQ